MNQTQSEYKGFERRSKLAVSLAIVALVGVHEQGERSLPRMQQAVGTQQASGGGHRLHHAVMTC